MSASTTATHTHNDLPDALFVREKQVLAMVPITDATLWRWVKAGKFPAPLKLGPGTTAWRLSDVKRWAEGIQPNTGN